MGLLDGLSATNRKEPDRWEASGMDMGFYLLQRAGYDDTLINDVARTMKYQQAYDLYRHDLEVAG
jgi:hypothetical protein